MRALRPQGSYDQDVLTPKGCCSAGPSAAIGCIRLCFPNGSPYPFFASDALSSVSYATQEILLVLSLGGLAFFHYSPWIALMVVAVMVVVVASTGRTFTLPQRRRGLRGGDEEPRAERWSDRRQCLAGGLHPDGGGLDVCGVQPTSPQPSRGSANTWWH